MRTEQKVTSVGGYTVEHLLGVGGFATVYAARHEVLGRRAAIKILHARHVDDPRVSRRFRREAMLQATLRHPAIVGAFEFGYLTNGCPYFVMDLAEGAALDAYVRDAGPLSFADAATVGQDVASALDAAHVRGVVHCDVKPSNVMVHRDRAGRLRAHLLDFGIAKLGTTAAPRARRSLEEAATVDLELTDCHASEPAHTEDLGRLGSPISMSPEQLRCDEVDARTDVYGLGVVLYFALTGEYPFLGATAAELERLHLHERPPPPSGLVPGCEAFDAIVVRCMAKTPADRYSSADELRRVLRGASRRQVRFFGRGTPKASMRFISV